MTDSEAASAPRRSHRDRKLAKHFTSVDGSSKRKREDSDTENDNLDLFDQDNLGILGDDEEGEEYSAPKPKPTTSPTKPKGKRAPKAKGPPASKKPRTAKAPAAKKSTTHKARKPNGVAKFDAAGVAKDTKITADNPLFNAIMNPAAALQGTAEDFLESLTQSPGAAQAEFINLVLRSCGCNDSVDADSVLDYDGVVDDLDDFTELLKKDDSPVYPLTSKLPVFKKFRKSLAEFIERLIASAADLGLLYTSDLMATLQTWVIAMSSSQIRSFRHTATVIALEVETALCDVAAAVDKEAEVVGRQREGERKRKASNKRGRVREKELEGKAEEVRDRRMKLAEFLKEFIDGVFVHRYRDLDPSIRAECVRSLGLWFKKYPGHFLDGSYLRYVGWVLSDSMTQVRLEAVKALSGVYAQADYIGSLNHFTERFKPRLVEMAEGDTELGVRVTVIQVLEAIDGHSLLEDEERERLCLLVFDEEVKVRKAVSQFVRGVWEDAVDEHSAGRKLSEEDKQKVGVKALAALLVKWGKVLDKATGQEGEDNGAEGIAEGASSSSGLKQAGAIVGLSKKGRMAHAVEALWHDVEPVSDWEGLLDLLLLDHSAAREDRSEGNTGRANTEDSGDDSVVDEAWRLEEVEEGVLLEVLVAALSRAKADVVGVKKGEEDTVANDITRALIKGLPRLFIKHQTDQTRIAEVLLIPTLMNLDLYLEMRMITGYSSLWDDVTKQFLSHSSLVVLTRAIAAIRHFMDATSLSNTNSAKILELEDELSSSLRDAVAGRDEIEVASFTEDEVLLLGSICMRLTVLAGTRNMTAWIEENEGGKQSSAWDIVGALVERGRLGYKEEEMMITQAIHLLTLYIMWKARALTADAEPSPEEVRFREGLQEQRGFILEKVIEYAVGTQSNTVDSVKRAAFHSLMNIHILFCPARTIAADGGLLPTASLALTLDDEVQYRCAGFIQAEIEQFSEDVGVEVSPAEDASDEELTSEGDNRETDEELKGQNGKAGKGKNVAKGSTKVEPTSRQGLEREYVFMEVMSTFLRAIRAGAIHPRHGAVLLAHYGRLGHAFDLCCKVVVDVLREEGMCNNNGEVVVTAVMQAIQESFTLVLDGMVQDEAHSIALSKLLHSCLLIRGAQLSVVRRLENEFVVRIHTGLLTWIGKRLTIYENNNNNKGRKTAALFFKVLLPLLTVESNDAPKIKAHMDQILAQAKVEMSPTSKIWEPQRAYEKRLSTTIAKDKAPKGRKTRTKGKKGVAEGISDEGEGSEAERLFGQPETVPSPPPRPKPRPKPRAVNRAPSEEPLPITETGDLELDVVETDAEVDPTTPKARPRPKATYRVKSPTKTATRSPSRSFDPVDAELSWLETPPTSRKRMHPEDEAEAEDLPAVEETRDLSLSREPSLSGDIHIRRKRVRH